MGANPLGYHLVNVLLHAFSAVLCGGCCAAEGSRRVAGGLIFAVHPVDVESAAWITERKNTLSMVFY